ncbi:hypothetical protein F5Y14DRAFT_446697 [Nemania sp. NC0429]|nr:hypothetical protein F5Y14DRAFT_446697 [Nemania sp. NC0429]
MESIKRFFNPKKKKRNNPKPDHATHMPVDGSYKKVAPEGNATMTYPPRVSSLRYPIGNFYPAGNATIGFIPQARGRQETMAWLDTPNALESILKERDRAAKQVRRGPMTKGTSEVQLILKEPSYTSVEKFHNVQQRTEMTTRYGLSGTVAYNFSKSLGWNMANRSRIPSLQLRDLGTRMRQIRAAASKPAILPFSPMNWLVLPTPTTADQRRSSRRLSYFDHGDKSVEQQQVPDLSPIYESGVWSDSNQVDIADLRPSFKYDIPLTDNEWLSVAGEEEDEQSEKEGDSDSDVIVASTTPLEGEATMVMITPVSPQDIREVRV